MVAQAVIERQQRAREQSGNYFLFPDADTEDGWVAQKLWGEDAGTAYFVNPKTGQCSCPDSTRRLKGEGRRKHAWIILAFLADGGGEQEWAPFSFEPETDNVEIDADVVEP